MVDITFIIPYHAQHATIVDRAIASVKAQTIPCAVVVIEDTESRGPGWARNRGLEQVGTRFVSFLDADDAIAPNFAQLTLAAIRPGKYVYTNWWESGNQVKEAPLCAWTTPKSEEPKDNTAHLITTLIATEDARRTGGFDEALQGMEDTDFYIKLMFDLGICGKRLNMPLVYYQPDAQNMRSKTLKATHALFTLTKDLIAERSKGKTTMCCGGDKITPPDMPDTSNLPPDYVLAETLWQGYRREIGRVTGIQYPRSGYGETIPVHKKDLAVMVDKFRAVPRSEVERRSEPEPDDMERVTFEPHYTETLADFFKAATGATDPSPPVYDPFAGQRVSVGRERDLSKVYGKLGEMLR